MTMQTFPNGYPDEPESAKRTGTDAWHATQIIKEALREHVGDGDGEDERILDEYTREICAGAITRAKVTLDLEDLASHYFIASDGIGSVGINTNETAKNKVLKGLDDLAKQYRRGRA